MDLIIEKWQIIHHPPDVMNKLIQLCKTYHQLDSTAIFNNENKK